MSADIVKPRGARPNNGKAPHRHKQAKAGTLSALMDRPVIVITRSGHWFHGILRGIDSHGILITTVRRILPKVGDDGKYIEDTPRMVTLKQALPFEIPVDGIGDIVVRKMFIAWGVVAQVLRAKTREEIEQEERLSNNQQ